MELVLILLAVVLLVVLPVAFFLLAIGGLFYALARTIGGEKTKGSVPPPSPDAAGKPPGADEPSVAQTASSNGRKDA